VGPCRRGCIAHTLGKPSISWVVMLGRAFVTKLAVEALDVRVLDRLAGRIKRSDAARVGPRVECAARKLRPVVQPVDSIQLRDQTSPPSQARGHALRMERA
jgi:hypothetical protein